MNWKERIKISFLIFEIDWIFFWSKKCSFKIKIIMAISHTPIILFNLAFDSWSRLLSRTLRSGQLLLRVLSKNFRFSFSLHEKIGFIIEFSSWDFLLALLFINLAFCFLGVPSKEESIAIYLSFFLSLKISICCWLIFCSIFSMMYWFLLEITKNGDINETFEILPCICKSLFWGFEFHSRD